MADKAIIIGATSGIGRALAVELHRRGYAVGATGRRIERLEQMQQEFGDRLHIQYMDVSRTVDAQNHLSSLIGQMGGMDIIVLNAGVSNFQGSTDWEEEQRVIEVNVLGFTALANQAFDYFERQESGQIVGISSIAGMFGYGLSATYNASKAFVSTYLQGYRQKANHSEADITVTDIKPGFVESEMTEGKKGLFWVASQNRAAIQIADAIEKRKNNAYITRRWRLIGWLIKLIPSWVFDRI